MSRIFLFLAAASLSAAPVIRDIQPRGAQRGKTFQLVLRGEGLTHGSRIQTSLPGSVSRLVPRQDLEKPDSELPFLVELKPDAPVGLYPLRLITSDGISNVVLVSVGALPEAEEIESLNPKQSNGAQETAQSLAVPAVVSGTLTAADIDVYSFQAKAGQKLVFEVEARRAGSAIDPAIELLDSTGRALEKNDDARGLDVDARLEFAFQKAGQYFVRVRDSKYSDQAQNFYRLKIGSYAYAEGLFPLGWRRGEPVDVSFVGGNLAAPVNVKAPAAAKGSLALVSLPGSASLPLPFVVGDDPEVLESESRKLSEGVVLNGRIERAGEIDRYQISVKAGEQWLFDVAAASLGTSQLDALLTLYDAAGKKLASRDDVAGADPTLPFTIPDGLTEVTVAVEDLLGRGGPAFGYRLVAKRSSPDFLASLATPFVNVPAGGTAPVVVAIQRRGFDGPIRLRIPDLPPGFQVAGGHVPPEAAAQSFNDNNAGFRTARSVLTITAEPEMSAEFLELTVVAEAETSSGEVMRRVAEGPGLVTAVRGLRQAAVTAPWLGIHLPVAISKPLPVTLAAPTPLVRIAQGFEYQLHYRARRKSGARPLGRVNNQTAGAVGNLRILRGESSKNPDADSVLVATNFATPITTFDMILDSQIEVDGKQVTVTAPAITFQIVPGYRVELREPKLEVASGGRLEIAGSVYREPTFEGGLVRIQAQDLPEHVDCAAVEVPAEQREFTMSCQAGSAAQPGFYDIRISSVAPETGRKAKDDYKGPELTAKLKVAAATQAAR